MTQTPMDVEQMDPEAAAYSWLEGKYLNLETGDDPADRAYDSEEMIEAFLAGAAMRSLSHGASAVEDADHVGAAVAATIERCAKVADEQAAKWLKEAAKHTRSDNRRSDHENSDLARSRICQNIGTTIRALPPEGDAS